MPFDTGNMNCGGTVGACMGTPTWCTTGAGAPPPAPVTTLTLWVTLWHRQTFRGCFLGADLGLRIVYYKAIEILMEMPRIHIREKELIRLVVYEPLQLLGGLPVYE